MPETESRNLPPLPDRIDVLIDIFADAQYLCCVSVNDESLGDLAEARHKLCVAIRELIPSEG